MAVPKGKVSRARRDKRRSSTCKLPVLNVIKCPNCGAFCASHRVCAKCGQYKGRAVINVEAGK